MTTEGKQPAVKTRGWHMKKEHVDSNGDIYEMGIFTGKNKNDGANPPEKKSEIKPGQGLPPKNDDDIPLTDAEEVTHEEGETIESLSPELQDKIADMVTDQVVKAMEIASKKMEADRAAFSQSQSPVIATADAIAKAMVEAKNFENLGSGYTNPESLDPGDVLENPVTFTSYGQGYLIVDDVRNGHPVKTPYGRYFKFKLAATRITSIGRNNQEFSASCTFTTTSKKEVAWLLAHTKYGKEFWQVGAIDPLDVDASTVIINTEVVNMFSRIEASSIISRAIAAGLSPGITTEEARTKLVAIEVKRRVAERDAKITANNKAAIDTGEE